MLASKFIETELNAYITNQRLIPQDNLVRLIAKAFEAYDEYKRLVSVDLEYYRSPKDHNSNPKGLHPRINQKLDLMDKEIYSNPDLDQDFSDPCSKVNCPHGLPKHVCYYCHEQDL